MSRDRIDSLDFLRGIAVIFMMLQHFSVWFVDPSWLKGDGLLFKTYFYLFMNMLGGYSAPAFIMISGMGSCFFLNRDSSTVRIIKRGLFITACGYLLNILAPIWFKPWSWYVLHLIGVMMMTAPLLKKLCFRIQILIAVVIFAAALIMQSVLDIPLHMGHSIMNDISRPGGFFTIAVVGGYFPLLPWAAFFITGFAFAPFVAAKQENRLILPAAGSLVLMGILGLLSRFVHSSNPVYKRLVYIPSASFYPLVPIVFLLLMGIVLFSVILMRGYEHKKTISPGNPIVVIGRFSLSTFIIHIFVFKQLLSMTPYYRKIPFFPAFGAAYAVIGLYVIIASLRGRSGFKYSFEWLMRKIT